jgi:hypothetical protein
MFEPKQICSIKLMPLDGNVDYGSNQLKGSTFIQDDKSQNTF